MIRGVGSGICHHDIPACITSFCSADGEGEGEGERGRARASQGKSAAQRSRTVEP